MAQAKVVELIVTQDRRGRGTEGDPIRLVTELYTMDGRLVAFLDPRTREALVTNNINALEGPVHFRVVEP